jgi:hypothetical protein
MWNQFGSDPSFGSLPHRILIWLVMVLANFIMIAHTEVGWESYDNVVYLETKLRPKIIELTGYVAKKGEEEQAPLGYETYKGNLRGKGPKFWEIPTPIISFGLLIIGILLFGVYYPWTWTDFGFAVVNAVLFICLTMVARKMIRRRQAIGQAWPGELSK